MAVLLLAVGTQGQHRPWQVHVELAKLWLPGSPATPRRFIVFVRAAAAQLKFILLSSSCCTIWFGTYTAADTKLWLFETTATVNVVP